MFDPTSRYYASETAELTVTDAAGQPRLIRYKRRRFVPPVEGTTTLVEHAVAQGERLDAIAARYLGDPTQYWRVADGNLVLDPEDLTAQPGQTIRIALPTP